VNKNEHLELLLWTIQMLEEFCSLTSFSIENKAVVWA